MFCIQRDDNQVLSLTRYTDPVSVTNIASHVHDDNDISTGLVYGTGKKPSVMSMMKEYLGILAMADNPTPVGRASSFISFVGNSGKVQVEFEIIGKRLRRRAYEGLVRERYGDDAVRITRFLLSTGKMNGDQVYLMLPVTF